MVDKQQHHLLLHYQGILVDSRRRFYRLHKWYYFCIYDGVAISLVQYGSLALSRQTVLTVFHRALVVNKAVLWIYDYHLSS